MRMLQPAASQARPRQAGAQSNRGAGLCPAAPRLPACPPACTSALPSPLSLGVPRSCTKHRRGEAAVASSHVITTPPRSPVRPPLSPLPSLPLAVPRRPPLPLHSGSPGLSLSPSVRLSVCLSLRIAVCPVPSRRLELRRDTAVLDPSSSSTPGRPPISIRPADSAA